MRLHLWKARPILDDIRGSAVPGFALVMIPALMLVGAGIDFTGVAMSRMRLQKAVDAATLAVAAKGWSNDSQQIAVNYVQNQFPGGARPSIETTVSGSNVTVKAKMDVPMNVLQLAHVVDTVRVSASATATIGTPGDKPMEVVIAFDSTGSMNAKGKIAAAREAAKSLLDSLTNGGANTNVRMGLVPFTNRVRLSLTHRGASWMTNTRNRAFLAGEVCKTTYPDAVYGPEEKVAKTCMSDGAPFDCSYKMKPVISQGAGVKTCAKKYQSDRWLGCVSSQDAPGDERAEIASGDKVQALYNDNDCPNEVTRLGATLEQMKAAIDALKPKGETYIAPGMLWAWRALSPKPPFADGAAYGAANKIIVLLTDGANTRSFKKPGDSGTDVVAANEKLSKVCAAAKASGIRIFSVAFQVEDQSIKDILVGCASSPPYYFDAENNEKLKTAFHMIGKQVSALRLVK